MAKADMIENDEQTEQGQLQVKVVAVEDVATLKKKVSVEIPFEQINEKLDQNFGELARSAQLPGFRIGRAPRRLIEKRFGKDVREQVKLELIGAGVDQAIEEAKIKRLGEPDLDIEQITLEDDKPLAFSFEVEVQPEFDLPKLDGIEVTETEAQVTDDDIDEQINNARWRLAVLEDQADDAKVEKGDQLTVNMSLEVGDEPPTVKHDTEMVARSHPIEGIMFDKFEEALEGATVGKKVEIEAEVSKEHVNEDWRGKKAKLSVEINKVAKWQLPELDDELAQRMGFENVKGWKDAVGTELEARKGQQTRTDMENQVRSYLLENTKFEVPEGLIERQTEQALMRRIIQLRQMGMPPVLIEERIDDLRSRARDSVVSDLRFMFIADRIAGDQEIDVSEEEVNSVIANMAMSQGRRPERVREEMIRDGSVSSVFSLLRERKVLEKLLDQAKISKKKAETKSKATKKTTKKSKSAEKE